MIKARFIMDKLKLPKVNFQRELNEIAEKIVIPDMQAGIHSNKDIDGNPFPPNEPKTVKRKGHNRVLIGEERKLVKSFLSEEAGKYRVRVRLDSERADVGRYLQLDGIRSNTGGLKTYPFFGIRKSTEKEAVSYMEEPIKKAIDNAR